MLAGDTCIRNVLFKLPNPSYGAAESKKVFLKFPISSFLAIFSSVSPQD